MKTNARTTESRYSFAEAVADLSAMFSSPDFAPMVPANSRETCRLVIEWAEIFEARNKDREWGGEYLEEIEAFFREQYAAWHNAPFKDGDGFTAHPGAITIERAKTVRGSLKALLKLHADSVFVCGSGDERRVASVLKRARNSLL